MRLTIAQITAFSQALTIVPARDPQRVIQRLSWDSRTLSPDTLFVALPGEQVDGNDFIIDALRKGAAVVIASRQANEAERFAAEQHRAALLYAADGVVALQRLASAWRTALDVTAIGITGSSGKTSTRAFVSAVLEKAFLTVSSLGNRNNEIGLPATVLSASSATEVLVVEMAMRGIGQIADLCAVACPQIGIITNIGPVHLELLGTKDNVARAKAELIEALPDGRGVAILNGDDPYTPRIREIARTAERGIRVVLFGLGAHNDIRAAHVGYDSEGRPSFDLWLPDGRPRPISLDMQGEHSVYNALAAAAAGTVLEVDPQLMVSALAQVQPVAMRQVSHELDDGALVIDDTYNANPDSMRAALELLARLDDARPHVAVLGDMGELGDDAASLHEGVGQIAHLSGVDTLVAVGALAQQYAQGARLAGMEDERIFICADIEEAMGVLVPLRREVPIILVKASRFMALERIVSHLIEGYEPPVSDVEGQYVPRPPDIKQGKEAAE
ncbi:MAG: UDP-N-acetylmuramoyl-tripeptide--D-alanyl-D-alanine ligase [Coriobacteriales bacterium]|jgi:UDP-N-acetylmuramoyl-tripeptide--D-alanyl-D-alanine ligase|nr:UDP-N-acetylmuramoyl-tripeptide--D-alanyl-D-alanine ligase [Coriobacteriales bacterium]